MHDVSMATSCDVSDLRWRRWGWQRDGSGLGAHPDIRSNSLSSNGYHEKTLTDGPSPFIKCFSDGVTFSWNQRFHIQMNQSLSPLCVQFTINVYCIATENKSNGLL
eukprot:306027_1